MQRPFSFHTWAHAHGLLFALLCSWPQAPPQAPSGLLYHHQQQQQQQASFRGGSEGGPAGMDIEGGTGPGPPAGGGPAAQPHDLELLACRAEGASYVCQLCGGVVSVARQQAHQQLWCPALQQRG